MQTRLAAVADAPEIARLHVQHLPPTMSSLTQLGARVVEHFYRRAIECGAGAVVTAPAEGALAGFLLVTSDVNALFRRSLVAGPLDVMALVASVPPIGLLKVVWKAVSSGTVKIPAVPEAVYLVVDDDFRGRGCGRDLMNAGEAWLRSASIGSYECHVHADNQAVLRLHLASGMVIRRSYTKQGAEMHVLYKKL
jgi:GNAT superfamily N-acetyltransferase